MKSIKDSDEEFIFDEGILISSKDLDGTITHANRKFYEISGYTKEQIIGKSHSILIHPDMPMVIMDEVQNNLHCGLEWNGVVKNLRKDGRYYWTYSHVAPLQQDGVTVGCTVTRRPALQREIDEAQAIYTDLLMQEKTQSKKSELMSLTTEIDLIEI